MVDVLVVGAGPAGSVTATRLARAGARVHLVDRASFPRPKLCGDTVNPGALALLSRGGLPVRDSEGVVIGGMVVTGVDAVIGAPAGGSRRATSVQGRYPAGVHGLALSRSRLDDLLLAHALDAGVQFEPNVVVTAPVLVEHRGMTTVTGARVASAQGSREIRAAVVVAADGRRSRLGFALGLIRHPRRPRRWAIGATFAGVELPETGEMHIRRNGYIGLSPLPGGLVNVCVVTADVQRTLQRPAAFLAAALSGDPLLRERLADARLASAPMVLGPLAVESTGAEVPGLLTAGDAAGFIDPITGDGLRFAIHGGELAAAAALRALAGGWAGVHAGARRQQVRAFASKWRMNRGVRALVGSPAGIRIAAMAARVAPGAVEYLINAAGDVGLANRLAGADGVSGRPLPVAW
jgi:flavin-dependent dehydrogenase